MPDCGAKTCIFSSCERGLKKASLTQGQKPLPFFPAAQQEVSSKIAPRSAKPYARPATQSVKTDILLRHHFSSPPTTSSYATRCRGKNAQKTLQKSGKILDVIDFNENFRQVSSLLPLYKVVRMRYNISRRQDESPRPKCLLSLARRLRNP